MLRITSSLELGRAIREARTLQNMTQPQIAAIVGVGVRFIVDLEKGKPTCALDKSLKVAYMLGLNLIIDRK
jgi:HTH-type transcriptional regulator/antitoxin HipB